MIKHAPKALYISTAVKITHFQNVSTSMYGVYILFFLMLTIQVSPIYPLTIHISEKTNETKEEDRNSWHCGGWWWGMTVRVPGNIDDTIEWIKIDRQVNCCQL